MFNFYLYIYVHTRHGTKYIYLHTYLPRLISNSSLRTYNNIEIQHAAAFNYCTNKTQYSSKWKLSISPSRSNSMSNNWIPETTSSPYDPDNEPHSGLWQTESRLKISSHGSEDVFEVKNSLCGEETLIGFGEWSFNGTIFPWKLIKLLSTGSGSTCADNSSEFLHVWWWKYVVWYNVGFCLIICTCFVALQPSDLWVHLK